MNRMLRTAIATLIAALSVAAMIDAAPAKATIGPMEASLQIFQGPFSWCKPSEDYVVVVGLVRMSYSEAAQALNLPTYSPQVQIRLWGDDPFSDNLLHGETAWAEFRSQPDGLYFEKTFCVEGSRLNEDQSWTDNRDEVYAGVRLVNSRTGSTIRAGETNRVYDYF